MPEAGLTMGFNPHRKYKRTNADYAMVAAGLVIALLLVLWAAGAF